MYELTDIYDTAPTSHFSSQCRRLLKSLFANTIALIEQYQSSFAVNELQEVCFDCSYFVLSRNLRTVLQ
jgi:hypothetical protein